MKILHKLNESYFLGLYLRNGVEYIGIFAGDKSINWLIIHINLEYSNVLNNISSTYSKKLLINRMSRSFHFFNDKGLACYYFFTSDMLKEYNININNFDYYLAKLIINIVENLVFI